MIQINECRICKELEPEDTLYKSSDWDGGLCFEYINDIQYCPVCGAKLISWKERMRATREARLNENQGNN